MRRQLTAGLLAGLAFSALPALAQDQAAPAAPAAPAAAPAEASTVLATVNGVDITLGNVIVLREQLPQQYQSIPDDQMLPGLVDQLIDQTLLAATVSASPETDPAGVKILVENQRRSALATRAVQDAVGAPLDDAEVQAAYDAEMKDFVAVKEYNAAHILVATEDEAKAIEAELAAGGDFAAIAKEKSTDPGSGANGGSLGWFSAGQMVPEFEAAVVALKPGEISAPVQSQFGWHIVRLDEVRDSAPPPLDQVRPQIENEIRQERLTAAIEKLREGATIVKTETAIDPAAIRQTDLLQN